MNVGMLWFDNDPQADLHTKVERAANYYFKKYGLHPTLCFIHPSMAPKTKQTSENGLSNDPTMKSGKLEIRTTRSVLPNHLWIGINGSNAQTTS